MHSLFFQRVCYYSHPKNSLDHMIVLCSLSLPLTCTVTFAICPLTYWVSSLRAKIIKKIISITLELLGVSVFLDGEGVGTFSLKLRNHMDSSLKRI